MSPYNFTQISSSNSTVEMWQNVNTVLMSGYLGTLILIVLVSITYLAFLFSNKDPVKSLIGASFISFGLSMLLYLMELVPVLAVWLSVVGLGLGVAFWKMD